MSTGELVALGAVAGGTIFLGLPMGRMRKPRPAITAFLTAGAVGILAFLFVDVLGAASETTEDALIKAHDEGGSILHAAGLSATFAIGLAAGLLTLVYYDRWRGGRLGSLTKEPLSKGPGAAAVTDLPSTRAALGPVPAASRLALMIAIGIGFHNFSEGLAIGQSAANGEIALATLLVVGFALHNATEGFGIVAPFSAADVPRPSWRFLIALGLIGGGPTFVGTLVGDSFVNDYLYVGCLTLAAGSILFVVVELLAVLRKLGSKEIVAWGLIVGLLVGFATDFVIGVAGA